MRFKADVISYTTVIGGLGKAGEWRKALRLFDVMPSAGVEPNGYTYGAAIAACAQVSTARGGSATSLEMAATNSRFWDPGTNATKTVRHVRITLVLTR